MTKPKTVKTEEKAAQPPATALAVFTPEADMEKLITHAIDKNVAVETMEKLLAMRWELKAEWAREQFHQAMASFQSACPIIEKNTIVRNKGGTERYRYAALDSIVTQVRPLLRQNGFSYQTDAKVEGACVTATCIATHSAGHSEQSSFMVPIDKDAFMTAPQQFASALTFAKRYAFCNAFGLVTGDADDDATAARSQAAESAAEGRAPEGAKHRQTRAYEEEAATGTGTGNAKATAALLELSTWLAEHKVPEGFVLALLKERKMVAPNLAKLGNAPAGVIQRTLASKDRILAAFASSTVEGEGAGAPPPPPAKKEERGPFDDAQPGGPTTFGNGNGIDQTPRSLDERRVPVTNPTGNPMAVLEKHGFDDWRQVSVHFGKQKGTQLSALGSKSLVWWITEWKPKPYRGNFSDKDLLLDAALCLAQREVAGEEAD